MKYTDYLIERIKLEGIDNYRIILPIAFLIDFLSLEYEKVQRLVKSDECLGKTLEYNPFTTDKQALYTIIKSTLYTILYEYLKNKDMEYLIKEVKFKKEDFDGVLMFIKDDKYAFISLDDFLNTFDVIWNNRELKSDGLHHEVKLKRVKN